MELWTVGNKTILLLFVIITSYFVALESDRWLVLFFLIYLALNLILHIIKNNLFKQGMIILILIYLIVCTLDVNPYFILLFPLSAYELASFHALKQGFLLVLVLIPILFMEHSLLTLYTFITVFSFFNYVLIRHYMGRVNKQEDEMERMRTDLERITKKHNDNWDFVRTSEYMGKLEERNRLAQEIHDGIGHSITGALIQMEAAKMLLHNDPDQAEVLLKNAIGISKEGIEEIRLTLKDQKPSVEQLGINRLKSAVEAFGISSGLLTTVIHDGKLEIITPLQWRIIHENVTESLTNTAKYAKASAVHVEVRVLNRFIQSVVSDNGRGSSKIVKGLGLIGMEERTATVHGTVIADGVHGFTVTTLIPYGAR